MKVTLSPLVAGLSGTAADAVAAKWKGRQYVRKYTIPKNPRSALQVAVRKMFARMPLWFRSLPSELRKVHEIDEVEVAGLWQPMADADRLSIFNEMSRICLLDLQDGVAPRLMRGNPALSGPAEVEGAEGAMAKTVVVDWAQGQVPDGSFIVPLTIPVDAVEEGKEEEDVVTVHTPVEVGTENAALPVLTDNKAYFIVVFAINAATLAEATLASGGVATQGSSMVP